MCYTRIRDAGGAAWGLARGKRLSAPRRISRRVSERWPGFAADDGDVFDADRPVAEHGRQFGQRRACCPVAPRPRRPAGRGCAEPRFRAIIRSRELRFRWMIRVTAIGRSTHDRTTPSAGAGARPVGFQSTRRLRTGMYPWNGRHRRLRCSTWNNAPTPRAPRPALSRIVVPARPNSASSDSVACNVVTTN